MKTCTKSMSISKKRNYSFWRYGISVWLQ